MAYRLEIIPYTGERKWVGPFLLKSQAETIQQEEENKMPCDADNRPFLTVHKSPCQGIHDGCMGECAE
jgi:hypothetical protein